MNLKPVAIVLLILTGLGLYARVSRFEFVWRDHDKIVEPLQSEGTTLSTIWRPNGTPSYAPLTYTVWYGVAKLQQRSVQVSQQPGEDATKSATPVALDPRWFHILNIVWHIIGGIAVFLILELLLGNAMAAWFGALLFLVHPFQVEAVSMAYGLKTILGGGLSLLAVWQYLSFSSRINSYRSEERNHAWRSVTYASVLYIAACLANPLSVVTPIFAAVLEKLLPGQRSLLSDRKPKGPLVVWTLFAIPVCILAISSEAVNSAPGIPLWQKPFALSASYWLYLVKAIVPNNLAPDYGLNPSVLMSHWESFASILLTLGIVFALLWWREKPRTWVAATFFLFGAAFFPTSGIARFGFQSISTISDRYAYLSIFALSVGIAYSMTVRRAQILQLAGVIFMIVMVYLTRGQTTYWASPKILWQHTAAVNPTSQVARIELGREALARGDNAAAFEHFTIVEKAGGADAALYVHLADMEAKLQKLPEAIEHYRKAIELNSSNPKAYSGLGLALFQKGSLDESLPIFEKAISLNDRDPDTHLHFGIALQKLERYEPALQQFEKVLEISPKNPLAHALLGSVNAKLDRSEEAIKHLRAALDAKVEDPTTHLTLAGVLFSQGEFDEAAPHYEAALKAFPNNAEAHNNLGVIYLNQKKYESGYTHIQTALKLAPGDAEVFQNMAIAMFYLRRFQEAQQYFAKALNQNPKLPNAYFYEGEIARFQGDKPKARSLYFTAIKYDRDHADAHHQLGNMDYQEEKFDRAVYHYEAALRSRPNSEKEQASLQRAKRQLDKKSGH